jgi:type IV pilus assembly protein PilM
MLKRAQTSIGLDIGTHSIKLVGLRHTRKALFLTNFAVKELPAKPSADVIAEKIRELFREKNIKARKVTIGVSGAQVAIRRISLPFMPKKELKEAVKWEARKFISFPPEKAVVDFQLLGETVEEGVKKLDLIVAVGEGEFIENHLAFIKAAGLDPSGISTIPHALWHCMQMIPEAREGLTALIDIGATKTSINMVKDNSLQFTREIAAAGNAFTEAIKEAATLEGALLDFAEAEEIKKEYGIPKEEDDERAKGHVPLQKISFVMRPVLERLLGEIRRSFEFLKIRFNEEEAGRIFISGGGAKLKGLKEYIAGQLGTRVEVLTPFKDMPPILAIATGLAMGRAKELNLLPEEYKLFPKVLLQRYSFVAIACLVLFVLSGVYLRLDATCANYRRELRLKEARLASLQPANIRLVQLEEDKKRLDQHKALFPKTALEQPQWREILREISRILPKKTTLTHLVSGTKDTGIELRIKGIAFGADSRILGSILEIMQGLEESPFFSDVRLSSSRENNQYSVPGGDFELVCEIVLRGLILGHHESCIVLIKGKK